MSTGSLPVMCASNLSLKLANSSALVAKSASELQRVEAVRHFAVAQAVRHLKVSSQHTALTCCSESAATSSSPAAHASAGWCWWSPQSSTCPAHVPFLRRWDLWRGRPSQSEAVCTVTVTGQQMGAVPMPSGSQWVPAAFTTPINQAHTARDTMLPCSAPPSCCP